MGDGDMTICQLTPSNLVLAIESAPKSIFFVNKPKASIYDTEGVESK